MTRDELSQRIEAILDDNGYGLAGENHLEIGLAMVDLLGGIKGKGVAIALLMAHIESRQMENRAADYEERAENLRRDSRIKIDLWRL